MRKIWISLIAMSIAMPSTAVIARKGVYNIAQSDGSTISVIKVGDERSHIYMTTDGIPVYRTDSTEDFHYMTPSGRSDIKAHNADRRDYNELSFLRENITDLSAGQILQSRIRLSQRVKTANATSPHKTSEVVNKGKAKIPVLLVQYADKKFIDSDPLATFERFFKDGDESARQYFEDQSNGLFQPQFDVYGPYTLSGNRATYGGNDYWGNDKGVGTMVAQACIGLSGQIDFSQYDNDGDGQCDTVIVLYAGEGEASSDVDESVWPCQWELSSSDYKKSLSYNSTTIDRFAVFNELNVASGTPKVEGIGTFCHEFSHCLGLPDFYDTNYNGHFGMSYWSLMDSGCYNNDGYTPIGYSAYEKEFMGWLTIEPATENTLYTLPLFNSGNSATDKAVKITNPADTDEYYIIENRANQGWDEYMPAEGLMITHVTYSQSAWNNNTVNDYDLQRMTIIPADGELKLNSYSYYGDTYYEADEESLRGDLWPYGQTDALTDDTTPSFSPNTGSAVGMPVTEMARNSDGTISFWIAKGQLPPLPTPDVSDITPEVNGSDSFTAIWQASDIDDVTYTLNVFEHQDVSYELALSSKFVKNGDYTDNWSTEGSTEFYTNIGGTTEAIKLGSSSKTGAVVTKSGFAIGSYDCATVVINARSFGSDSDVKMKVSAMSGSTTLSSSEVTITNSAADYVVLLPQITGDFTIRIETVASKKRAYLYSADIYLGDAASASAKSRQVPVVSGDQTDMTISGITGTQYTVTGLKPGAVYDYRVKAVPTNDGEYSDSPWSATVTVDLSSASVLDYTEDSESEAAEYFNLQGIRVNPDSMKSGIYIKRQGSESSKIYIK
ncbi:MAG: hypothetical protein C7K11_08455 [Candidatus Amulumruptor caecigallinarius]|uniref:M6 family metalloprotease domain-containing protein n=1 Tax=Candidatus Amulumruptor caecigallinarius TaxID=2109911 RepID=A0A4Q0U768_9BACT|nr:MAG: hypothetical protein C7K11_08455 [Candidatus Amulumruptor caecigallinarius]HJE39457.1 M6 family metalloprotease domain-containing protein [Candidatus Amulumruptor caecigallinarius]